MNNSFTLVVSNSSSSKKSSGLHFSLTVTYGLEEQCCSLCCIQCHAVLKAQKDSPNRNDRYLGSELGLEQKQTNHMKTSTYCFLNEPEQFLSDVQV